MVRRAESYPWSSQRAYLGIEPAGIVDVDPVLRLFGARKAKARENFALFVAAGAKLGRQEQSYQAEGGGCILGSEVFVDSTIHRIWEAGKKPDHLTVRPTAAFDAARFVSAAEKALGVRLDDLRGPDKRPAAVRAKEALIVAGRRAGATVSALSRIAGIDPSNVSRRYDAAIERLRDDPALEKLVLEITRLYEETTK